MPILATTIFLSAAPAQACLLPSGAIASVAAAPGGATLTLGSGSSRFLARVDAANAHLAASSSGVIVFAAPAYGSRPTGSDRMGRAYNHR